MLELDEEEDDAPEPEWMQMTNEAPANTTEEDTAGTDEGAPPVFEEPKVAVHAAPTADVEMSEPAEDTEPASKQADDWSGEAASELPADDGMQTQWEEQAPEGGAKLPSTAVAAASDDIKPSAPTSWSEVEAKLNWMEDDSADPVADAEPAEVPVSAPTPPAPTAGTKRPAPAKVDTAPAAKKAKETAPKKLSPEEVVQLWAEEESAEEVLEKLPAAVKTKVQTLSKRLTFKTAAYQALLQADPKDALVVLQALSMREKVKDPTNFVVGSLSKMLEKRGIAAPPGAPPKKAVAQPPTDAQPEAQAAEAKPTKIVRSKSGSQAPPKPAEAEVPKARVAAAPKAGTAPVPRSAQAAAAGKNAAAAALQAAARAALQAEATAGADDTPKPPVEKPPTAAPMCPPAQPPKGAAAAAGAEPAGKKVTPRAKAGNVKPPAQTEPPSNGAAEKWGFTKDTEEEAAAEEEEFAWPDDPEDVPAKPATTETKATEKPPAAGDKPETKPTDENEETTEKWGASAGAVAAAAGGWEETTGDTGAWGGNWAQQADGSWQKVGGAAWPAQAQVAARSGVWGGKPQPPRIGQNAPAAPKADAAPKKKWTLNSAAVKGRPGAPPQKRDGLEFEQEAVQEKLLELNDSGVFKPKIPFDDAALSSLLQIDAGSALDILADAEQQGAKCRMPSLFVQQQVLKVRTAAKGK